MTSILVVEDEPGISSFVAKGLTSAGYNVTVVAVSYTHLDVYKRQLWGLPQ